MIFLTQRGFIHKVEDVVYQKYLGEGQAYQGVARLTSWVPHNVHQENIVATDFWRIGGLDRKVGTVGFTQPVINWPSKIHQADNLRIVRVLRPLLDGAQLVSI